MAWYDIFRVISYAFVQDPLAKKKDTSVLSGIGTILPDTIDLRNADGYTSGANSFIRIQNDLVDLTSTANRQNRYKEYDRLAASVPEIDMAMTVLADEACVSGETEIATVYYGHRRIDWLAKHKPTERFPVYCFDEEKQDYTIGWAFNPRLVRKAKTVEVLLDNGEKEIVTVDHRIMLRNGKFVLAGHLKYGDELMPFYRLPANQNLTKKKVNQYPRIFTFTKGWVQERQLIDEWMTGIHKPEFDDINLYSRMINQGSILAEIWKTFSKEKVDLRFNKSGFSYKELKFLAKNRDRRRVVDVRLGKEIDVYDLSVEKHENFCTKSLVMHNCQKDEDGHVFKIECDNEEVIEELTSLYFNRSRLNFDQRAMWDKSRRLFIKGDEFWELVIDPDNPKLGVIKIQDLPPESMYRIETTKGKILEFQQGKEGPDYQALLKGPILAAPDSELNQAMAYRFAPQGMIHIRIGDFRKTFYPYGVSLIESARGPAHQLRMIEDAMVVYRLTRAPERRIYYIDVAQLPPNKVDAFMDRIKDQLRKKKVVSGKGAAGLSSVEERYHVPAQDEDIWMAIRPDSKSRVETLPGACLALDTKIPLLDGRTLPLSEIIEEYQQGADLWAFSCDPSNGKPAPGRITWAGITRKNTQVLKITLDNGESITCTPDHNFPVLGKGKTQAKDLVVGESLIPFNTRLMEIEQSRSKYLQVYDTAAKEWVFVHRMVTKFVKKTKFEKSLLYSEIYKDEPKTVVHHVDCNRFNNSPSNLAWMGWLDHRLLHNENRETTNANISKGLKLYHENLSEEEKQKRDKILAKRSKKGIKALNKKLQDPTFNKDFSDKQKQGWAQAKIDRPELHAQRGQKITARNLEFWSNPENKKKVFAKQTVMYPKPIMDFAMKMFSEGKLMSEVIDLIKTNQQLIDLFVSENKHIVRKDVRLQDGLDPRHFTRMVKQYGYKTVNQAKKEAKQYNHKIVNIEYLVEKIDTGTLTIDGNEEIHGFHTFAISPCGIYTYNSNLGEIDDCVYFRNKLFTALNFPKNYFSLEDPNATRITLSAQDVKFARFIERLQSYVEDALYELAARHLHLMGYPPESYESLQIKMTPPSDWRELSRAEVITNRINNANALKGSQLMSDFDILTKWMKYSEDEANEMISRMKLQKLEDLKLQVLAQNPALLGVGMPGQGEAEMGAQPGGPNPPLSPEGIPGQVPGQQPPPEQMGQMPPGQGQPPMPPPPEEDQQNMLPPKAQAKPLPEPSEDEINKYDLEIQDYEKDQDYEDLDWSEVE